jgi:signal transduction histidine kinase
MFRTKLYLAFFALVLITLLQATLASWAGQTASNQVERGRIANQLLTNFIALGADKQRLKVWLAQALLTKEAPLTQRDHYLARMQQSLTSIDALLLQDQALASSNDDFRVIALQMKNLAILQTNVEALQRSLHAKSSQTQQPRSEAEIWRLLIQTFDNLEGLDLKQLIAGSIEIQKQRSAAAEQAATAALAQAKILLISCGVLGSLCAVLFALLLAKASYRPLQSLLQGTAAISRGELSYRLPEQGDAEFALLSRSFNQMATALERAHQAEQLHSQQTELVVQERTAQLQQALAELQQAELSQKRFLADVSHELRTPATAIRGEAEIMLRGQDKSSSDYKDSLLRIVDTSVQLSGRIDELLMLVRGENELQIRFKHFQLSQLWISWTALAKRLQQSSSIDICWPELSSAQRQVLLYLDAERSLQALQIVLDNAIRYGAGSAIVVALDLQPQQLLLSISDQGIGVPLTEQHQLFSRFFRASNARAERADGLGIGLALCRSMMQAQHGDIQLQSPWPAGQHRGCRVLLSWPLASADDELS